MILPVILSGGSGSRLWPLSREQYPKQYLSLASDKTMLQETFHRLKKLDVLDPIVICNEEQRFIAAEQIRQGGYRSSAIILEPVARDTAPAITLAACYSQTNNTKKDEPLLLVLPADHAIQDIKTFHKTISAAKQYAERGELVTFGIVPNSPEIGYGYIQKGQAKCKEYDAFSVSAFVEKPSQQVAKQYLESGEYLWNSGMFLFKASSLISEMKKYSPEIVEICNVIKDTFENDLDFVRVSQSEFRKCPKISLDYALMEKTENCTVVPLNAAWSDVGSWSALWEVSKKDVDGNVTTGDVISADTSSSYIRSESKLIATVGINNLIVVETADAILVAEKGCVQKVKSVVEKLKETHRREYKEHRQVYRPWGSYDSISYGDRDVVKRITVNPGQRLSKQMHHHRSEHWVVVAGTANVTIGESSFLVSEDQSTYIPLGVVHSLENPGKIPLQMIEIQTGSYLDENDIVRYKT